MRADPPKNWNYLLEGGPLVVQASLLAECSRNPPVSVYQLALLWQAGFGLWNVFEDSSNTLPISWWVIYEHTCPHHTECSAVFDQKQHDPSAPPSPFTWSPCLPPPATSLFFCFSGWKKVLKGKCFVDVEEVKQKMAEALKSIKIDEFRNCFVQVHLEYRCFEGNWSLNR